jgi:hypothetical protein
VREKDKAKKKKREALKDVLKKNLGNWKPAPQPKKGPTSSSTKTSA